MRRLLNRWLDFEDFGMAMGEALERMVRRLLNRFRNWIDSLFDMHVDFKGDLMTPESPDDPWWYK